MERKATERVYAGGKNTEGVEDGPDSVDTGMCMTQERQGHHMTQPSTETVGERFRRKDQEKSRR